MKKWITLVAIALLCATIMFPSSVYAATEGDYVYEDNGDGTCTITGYTGLAGEVTIPDEINGLTVTVIGSGALGNCGLVSVTIPSSVLIIDDNAFYGNKFTSITIPDGVTTIGVEAFAYNNITTVNLPSSVTAIQKDAFCDNVLTEFALPAGSDTWYRSDGLAYSGGDNVGTNSYGYSTETYLYTDNGDGTCTIDEYYGAGGDLVIPGTIESLTVVAFNHEAFANKGLTSVVIPNSVTSFGALVFSDNSLTSVIIPAGITEIDDAAFHGNNLSSVTFLGNITTIGWSAFSTNNFTSFTIPSTVTTIGSSAFSYNGLTSIDIPSSVTSIDDYAFRDNALTTVTIPSSVTDIGVGAFNNNQISMINSTASAGIIYARTASGADDITTVVSYGGVSDIIGPGFIPASVSVIETYAFSDCGLTSVDIPDGVTLIDDYAFHDNAIATLSFNGLTLYKIGESAFSSNSIGAPVVLPDSLTDIGGAVFASNGFFANEFILSGSGTNIWYGSDDNLYDGGDRANIYYSYSQRTYEYTDNGDGTCTIERYNGPGGDIVIPDNMAGLTVTDIANSAFKDSGLTSVSIAATVTSIEGNAFADNSLTSVTFLGNNVTEIGGSAFSNNLLTSFDIPTGVTEIKSRVLMDNSLTSITIPNGVTRIEYSAFKSNQIASVTIPSTVIEIIGMAFNDNIINEVNSAVSNGLIYARNADGTEDITTIVSYGGTATDLGAGFIPSDVTTINWEAFSGNDLTSVIVPNSVTKILSYAFSGNTFSTFQLPAASGTWIDGNSNTYAAGTAVSTDAEYYRYNQKPNRQSSYLATANETTQLNTAFTLTLGDVFEDADGDALTYEVNIDGAGYTAAAASYSYPADAGGTFQLVFRTHDGTAYSDDTYTVTLTVEAPPNRISTVSATKTEQINVNGTYSLDLATIFEDANNDSMTFELNEDSGGFATVSQNYSTNRTVVGSYELIFRAHDGSDYSTDTYIVTLNVTTAPTRISTVPATQTETILVNGTYSLDLATIFEDADNDPMTYELNEDSGGFASVSQNYSTTRTVVGSYELVFRAHDGSNYSTDTYTVTLNVQNGVYNINYSSAETADTATASHTGASYATLHDGTGFTRSGYIIDGWVIDSTNYMLGDLYLMPNADASAVAIWIADTDNDGVSDVEETAAGTDPNDGSDVPEKGDAQITVLDSAGNPVSGATCVINSTPVEVVTNGSGVAVFNDIYLTEHTLSIRNGSGPVSSYTLIFRNTGTNNSSILDNADGDNEGTIDTTFGSSFVSLNIRINQNASGYWVISDSSMSTLADPATNPQTGDISSSWWMIMMAIVLAAGCIYTGYTIWLKTLKNK